MNLTEHPCTQYAIEATRGERVVGKVERLACARHLEDLARQGDEDWPWVFDEGKANRIYKWFRHCKHVQGPLAGQPIELLPFQQFDLGCIFGWVHKDTGLRRFEKAYIQEARKQGKSTLMSGLALYLMCGDGEESPDVYCAAVDKDQARIIYRSAKTMAEKSPDIKRRLKIRQYEIAHATRGGQMRALSRETSNKDGLNPSGVILDEYHAHKTSEIYDLIWSAWGQRAQALFAIITTAGFETDQNPCYQEYEYGKKILEDVITNDRYFVIIRELDEGDDEHDPANWIKSNPLRAATGDGLAKLKEQHDEAFDSKNPAKIRNFRVKNLDVWVNQSEDSYIGDYLPKWNDLAVDRAEFIELTRGLPCNVGIDMSKTIDLTADAFLFWLPDSEKIAITAHGFIPDSAVERHEKTDRVPYWSWIEHGWVTATEGDVTDYARLQAHIKDQEAKNGWAVQDICFDPYNATHFANEMTEDGYNCVEIRQGVPTLSEPTKLFREMIATGRIVHDGSPILTWCLSNAVAIVDHNENIKLSKKNTSDTKRIDLVAAAINAVVRLPALKKDNTSVYSGRGVLVL